MNKLSVLTISIVLSACASYKVETETEITLAEDQLEEISVDKINKFPKGPRCFEPMLYLLTLGVVPTRCVDRYSVSTEEQVLGQVKVTKIQGWVTLFLTATPEWKFGYGNQVESEIKSLTKAKE